MIILLYILAVLRAIVVFGAMTIFMLCYGLSCIFVPHSKKRALQLRENFLIYVCLPVLNIKVIKTGETIDIPALYVGNHRSFADPIVLCSFLKGFVIAKAEVANYPIINKGAELTGVIWVNRNDKNSRTATRDKMVEVIQSGFNIIVYPEGTVGKEKITLPFRMGTFLEAAENNIAVVPVAIEFRSPKDLWVMEKFIPQYLHQFSKWKTEVKLSFGPVLHHKKGLELHQAAHKWINEELVILQSGWSEAFINSN